MNTIPFIEDTTILAQQHNVTLLLDDRPRIPYINSDLLVAGYFVDRPQLTLAVGIGKPIDEWLPILVHERGHMEQWIDKDRVWDEAFADNRETVDWIDEWTQGRDDLPMPIAQLIERSFAVELDCERRAIELIKKFELPIDIEQYTQKALSYVYYYKHMLHSRQWYDQSWVPYETDDIWTHAPKTLDNCPNECPVALQEAFRRYERKNRPTLIF